VSRRHVEFAPAGDGAYSIRDVGSLNGTYVNRERIDEAPLRPGDEVQIGKFKLVYLVAGNE
jgi:pSer/pThr/pTyr-binding forkhead associated (FHA) protein